MVDCFIFTALLCEAKPFIETFNLKKIQSKTPFVLYEGDGKVLTVTGTGKVAMATAMGYVLAKFERNENPVLMNIGIAGHQTAPLGHLWCANKIIEADTGRCYYPQPIIKNNCISTSVYTVSTPNKTYPKNALYDMEASAFYESATYFSTTERILVFKVVSDNQQESLEGINAKKVTEWMRLSVEKIVACLQSFPPLPVLERRYQAELLKRYYFNVNNRRQLQKQLQRWYVLTDGAELDFSVPSFQSAKAVLAWLQVQIDQQPYRL